MAEQDLQTLLQQADAAIKGGDKAATEKLLRDILARDPNQHGALYHLGLVLHQSGRSQEAANLLWPAAKRGTITANFLLLSEIFEGGGQLEKAVACYESALRIEPANHDALMKLAALRDKMEDKAGARELYRRAMEARPNDVQAALKYADAVWATSPETSVRVAEQLLAAAKGNLEARVVILDFLVCRKEWWERIRRGQMPYHASDLSELFFTHAAEEFKQLADAQTARLAAKPNNVHAKVGVGITRFCRGDRQGADEMFRSAYQENGGGILGVTRFTPTFYDELRAFGREQIAHGLPPLLNLTPINPDPRGTLYLSCNFSYFTAFTLPMLVSLRDRSPRTPVHVHIMDADANQADFAGRFLEALQLPGFALSIERPGLEAASPTEARAYYHAVRLIRYYEHLQAYAAPLWLMDVDAVINRDLADLFSRLDDHDAAMRIRPGRYEPWNQFNACVVGASPRAASVEYFRLIGAYIAYYYQRKNLRWGIDQLAMYGVFADMQDRQQAPSLALLDDREVDYEYHTEGFVWCNSGAGKFKHLQRIKQPGSLPLANYDGNKFVAVFEQYWKECQRIAATLGVTL